MATWRVNNSTALGGEVCAPWQANHAYGLGARCVCTNGYSSAARAYVYECTSAGTSHAATEPSWPTTVGNTVVDNEVTWTCRSPSDGSWDNATCFYSYLSYNGGIGFQLFANGDIVLVHDAHNETVTWASLFIVGSSAYNLPNKLICVDKADDSLSTGAVIAVSGGSYYIYLDRFNYIYGVTLQCVNQNLYFWNGYGQSALLLERCVLKVDNGYYIWSQGSSHSIRLINSDVSFSSAASEILVAETANFVWKGGTLIAPNGVTGLFRIDNNQHTLIQDVDLSQIGDGANARALLTPSTTKAGWFTFTRCKLPPDSDSGFTVLTTSWTKALNGKIRLHHCSNANKTYDFYETSYEGIVQDETTLVRTGGASDGTTSLSFKMASSANTVDNINGLISPDIHGWTDSTTEKTFTIECLVDSATNLQDDEIWMELEYPADDSSGLGAITTDKCAMLDISADQAASIETWTTTGMTNPNTFKLSVTVTPGKAGPITARVCLAKASTIVYVDPTIKES